MLPLWLIRVATTERLTPEQANRLGNLLHEWRRAEQLNQEQAAERLRVSRNYFQLLERGIGQRREKTPANPRLSTLILFAAAIGKEVPELVADIMFGNSDAREVEGPNGA